MSRTLQDGKCLTYSFMLARQPLWALEAEGLSTCLGSHRFSSAIDGKGKPTLSMAVRSVPSH